MAVSVAQLDEGVVFEVPSGRLYRMIIGHNVAEDITPPGWKDKRPDAEKKAGKKKKERAPETSGGEKTQPTKIFTFGEIAEREGLRDVSELMEQTNLVSSRS